MKRWLSMILSALAGIVLWLAVAGCATRIDWNSRAGLYTYDQAITELGPPDKSAKTTDGTTVAEWLIGHFWANPMQPTYRITDNCQKLIWEIGRQRFKDFSAQVALNKDQPEQLVDKDNHAWDALKMFLKRFPPPTARPKTPAKANTFDWWRKQIQRHKRGEPLRSFRV